MAIYVNITSEIFSQHDDFTHQPPVSELNIAASPGTSGVSSTNRGMHTSDSMSGTKLTYIVGRDAAGQNAEAPASYAGKK